MAKKPTYIDLFAGCGGLSLGLHHAGWQGLFAVEKSKDAFLTLQHNLIEKKKHFNWPGWLPSTPHDINEVLSNYSQNLHKLRGSVDLVAGGPPCQGFSTAGKRNEDDSRNGLIKSYIRFIRIVQPKIIFFENVKGFTQRFEKNKTKGKKYSEYVMSSLSRATKNNVGYHVIGKLVDFSEYGIPQKRTRFILVGIRKDICKNSPKLIDSFFDKIKNNRDAFLLSKGLSLNTNLEEAISDLLMSNGTANSPDSVGFDAGVYTPAVSNYQKYLRLNPHPENIADSHRFAKHGIDTTVLFQLLLDKAVKGKKITGTKKEEFNLKKRGITVLDSTLPAPTLTSHPDDYVHYVEPRILTVREYARIQSFPDWYEFRGKYTTGGILRKKEVPRYTQLGNAIPPLFGEQAGLALQQIVTL
jgi:DNA (cytosine-5)-methyltransferase 1